MSTQNLEDRCVVGDLCTMLQSGEGADVTLVVGDFELPAHSQILAARSPVFAAALRSDMLEARSRRIVIADMREEVLKELLLFLYSDKTPQVASVAGELLAAAEKYDLPLLKNRCELQMEQVITVENAAETAALAVQYSSPGLTSVTVEFIANHPEVMATSGWNSMLRDTVETAVKICSQLAVRPLQPSSESRIVPEELKQKLGANLILAAENGRASEVWALLTAGALKDVRDVSRNTALHLAAINGHASTVKYLITRGLDVNAVNSSKQTPLHMATQKGDTDIIWMLVAASAQVNAQDAQGRTPLHIAARLSIHPEPLISVPYKPFQPLNVVATLLLAGAKKDIEDTYKKKPESMTTKYTYEAFGPSFRPYNDL